MGFTPKQVDEMALWQFMACIQGRNEILSGGDELPSAPSAEEFYDMVKRLG